MTADRHDLAAAALQLRQAGETRSPCAPVRDLLGNDLAAAYAVQTLNHDHWIASGRRPVGRKIAVSSPAAQQAMGAGGPAWGMLYADMLRGDGDTVDAAEVLNPKLEGEIAVILGRDLTMVQPTLADVIRAVDWCLPAIEIAGSRIHAGAAKIVDLVADNANSGLVVLGSPARRLEGLDLRRQTMTMTKNGTAVASGSGIAVAGCPLHALAWLAADCVRADAPLLAGELVMTGTFFAMQPAAPGDAIEVIAEGLGRCDLRFSA